jgi:hypothetical protein
MFTLFFVPDAIANNTSAITATATFFAVVVKSVFDHFKGKRGKKAETARGVTLTDIHETLTASIEEQRALNARLEARTTGIYYIVTGGQDETGTNGLRSRVADHEKRIRIIEGDRPRLAS